MQQTLDRSRTAILMVLALGWALPLSAAVTETPTPVPGPYLQFSYVISSCGPGGCPPPFEAYEAQASTYTRYVDPAQPFGADLDSMDRIELFIDGALVSTESGGYSLPNLVGTIGDGYADLLVGCHTYQKIAYTTGGLSTASPAQMICLGTPTTTPTPSPTPTQSPSGAGATPTYTVTATRTPGPPVNFTKSLVAGDGSAGSQATYIIDLEVGGSTGANFNTIWDTLPANTSFLSSNPAPASVVGNVLSWSYGFVPSGSHRSITLVVSVDTAGDLCNQASYYSDHVFPAGLRTSGLACVGGTPLTPTLTPAPTLSATPTPTPTASPIVPVPSFTHTHTRTPTAGPIPVVDEGRVRIYPSPARGDRAWLALNLPQAGKARLIVLDSRMRSVINMEVDVPAGPYAAPIDIRGLRRGVYFYRAVLTLRDGTVLRPASGRFTVLR